MITATNSNRIRYNGLEVLQQPQVKRSKIPLVVFYVMPIMGVLIGVFIGLQVGYRIASQNSLLESKISNEMRERIKLRTENHLLRKDHEQRSIETMPSHDQASDGRIENSPSVSKVAAAK